MSAPTTSPGAPDATETPASTLPGVVTDASTGRKLSPAEERDALHYFLSAAAPPNAEVTVDYRTPVGVLPLKLVFKPLRGAVIDKIEEGHRKGDGPFAKLDKLSADADIVAEALLSVEDPGSGRQIDVHTQEFLQGHAALVNAITGRFREQEGLLTGVADQVRAVSGWSGNLVSEARQVAAIAVGGS